MKTNFKLGTWETVATSGCISLVPILLTIPTLAVESFGTAAFAHNIYTTILALVVLSVIFHLYRNFSNMDIIDLYEYVGGKPLQIFGGILVILYLVTLVTLTFGEFTLSIQNIVFPDAPQEYIAILFCIAMIISSLAGMRGIFRTGSLIAPLIISGIALMFISLFENVDPTNFTPIFGNGIENFFWQGPLRISRYEGVFLIFLLIPYIKNYKKVGYSAFTISAVLILSTVFLLTGILHYPSITENFLPMFELTRLISFGRFIQRVESIFVLLSLLATFVYLSLGVSFSSIISKKIFNLQDHKRLIPLFTIIIASTSIILNSFEIVTNIREFVFLYVSPSVIYISPIILLIIANIKRRIQCKKLISQNTSS